MDLPAIVAASAAPTYRRPSGLLTAPSARYTVTGGMTYQALRHARVAAPGARVPASIIECEDSTMHRLQKTGLLLGAIGLLAAAAAVAELEPYEDFDLGETVYTMTTVKVDANMDGVYLEGLKQTWVAANEVAKELGHIVDYRIFSSELSESGDFNLVLVIEHASLADLAPSKERYQAFMKAWGEANRDRNQEISETYPEVRTITGEYLMRELTIHP